MRIDPAKDEAFSNSSQWDGVNLDLRVFRDKDSNDPSKGSVARSYSGHERNRMFIQTDDNFEDVSLVSGADTRKDSRGFVMLDYDRDGWVDLGITSPLSPRFRIFRNTIGDDRESPNRAVFVSVRGGNTEPKKNSKWSNRDGIGAKILVTIGDEKRIFQASCGEGLASQNSKWIHIGMGHAENIDQIDVSWPSGKKTVYNNIASGTRVTLFEDGRIETGRPVGEQIEP